MHHAFLYISFPSLYDYDVKMPKFTFCGGREHKTTTSLFFSWTPEKNSNIWQIERDGISTIKFEAAWIHFLSDVFMAVTVVAAKAP